MLATRFKGNKGGLEKCKAQRVCFAYSNEIYCRLGNRHNEKGKDFGRSGNFPIVCNA